MTLSQLLAPFTPFIADEIYRNLVGGHATSTAPVSVHLSRWPQLPARATPTSSWSPTWRWRSAWSSLGRAARESAGLKLRQPLAEAIVGLPGTRRGRGAGPSGTTRSWKS